MVQATSVAAFQSVNHEVRTRLVLSLFNIRPDWTADEAAEYYGMFHNSIAPAFTALKKQGLIYRTEETRMTRCHRQAIVWRLTPDAPQA